MEAARALAGSAACGALGSARRASGSAASGSGAGACASARARVRRWVAPTAEARPVAAPRGSSASTARPTRWRERGADAIGNRGSRVAARAAGDSGGGDGERAPRASPPARPRRPRRVGASSASSPGSSSPETAEVAPADTRAAAAAGRLRSERMKSPAATAALSSVRARSAADRGADRSLAALRTEASTILRALAAARAAPGGLRGAFGDDPDLLDRLLGALCRAGMLPQAADALRDAIEADAGNEKHIVGKEAVETVVRHAARAGRCRESGALAAFTAFRENARKQAVKEKVSPEAEVSFANFPTLRAYTDVISALGKAEARRARRGGGGGGGGVFPGVFPDADKTVTDKTVTDKTVTAVDVWRMLEDDVLFLRERGDDVTASELEPDGAAYTAAAAAFLAAEDEVSAEALTRAMRRRGVDVSARLYNVFIAHEGHKKNVEGVRAVERAMATTRVRPNAATHGARVAAYCRCGEIELAARALASGRADPDARRRPTVRAYTALVQAYARDGNVEAVDATLALMRGDGVAPNCHTYTVAVDGLVERGDARGTLEAERFVRDMRVAGIEPSVVTYNCLLKGVLRTCGSIDDDANAIFAIAKRNGGVRETKRGFERAERVLEEMRARGVSPTVVTYNTLIDACVSRGEPAESMFKVLSALVRDGHRPDVVTYTTLLKHFGKRGDVVAARWLMREMEADANVRVDASAVNALVDALCRGGRTREATEVARAMRETLNPDANTYGALLDGFARVGDDRSAAALYAALKRRGEGADGRGWSPSWCDDEEKEKDFSEKDFSDATTTERVPAERVCASARAPDARMRAAVVAACAASVARRSAEARASPVGVKGTPSSRVAGVVEAVIADAAAADAAGAAAEAVALRERWRRESTRAGVEAGRTVRRVRANARGARGEETVAQNDGGSRRERRRNARAVRAASANAVANDETLRSDASPDGVTRGMEMWKHWLGLPSRYYAPGGESLERLESDVESDDIVAPVSATTESTASQSFAESTAESTAVDSTTGKNSAEKRYTRAEIAEAVRTLRAAASKKFPGDPETALRAALDAAGEGDTGRVVFTDDDP